VSGQVTPLSAKDLGGGSLSGLLEFQNSDLVDARNRLGQLMAGLASAANTQQSFGIDLSGAQGTDLFTLGKSVALPATSNASAGGVPLATVTVQLVDAKALKPSEYTMEDDPNNPGAYRVTRLADAPPTVFSNVQPGDVIDGFSFSLGAPPPSAGDRFLLQPSSAAANGMEVALSNPRSVAAASPLTAVAALANTGTASVGSLMIVAAKTAPYQQMTVHFTDANGGYELLDSGGAQLATGTWSPQTPIAYNGFELRLEGQPALDDKFNIDLTAYPAGNNGNALAFDNLANRNLVDGQSVTDAYALLLSDVGVRVQGAISAADTSSAVSTRASEALTSEVGVNLDEEAAKLIQFQQAYQAAAKMLQTAQTIMDTLLQLGH
jgi:flagellar hook-associated protein 1 FlgK